MWKLLNNKKLDRNILVNNMDVFFPFYDRSGQPNSEAKLWKAFWRWIAVNIMRVKLDPDFEGQIWFKFWSWSLA